MPDAGEKATAIPVVVKHRVTGADPFQKVPHHVGRAVCANEMVVGADEVINLIYGCFLNRDENRSVSWQAAQLSFRLSSITRKGW